MTVLRALSLILVLLTPVFASAQPEQSLSPQQQQLPPSAARDTSEEVAQLRSALVRLPLAAVLASILAVRPRRRGTPHRKPAVIETQIILAVVGAVVMLVVGSSLARAFGIVGAAGLVRYRAKIDDPKDAGVMLSTLAVGLAAGVGLWMIATFSAAFILAMLFVIESLEPAALTIFELTVKAKDPATLKPKLEELLKRNRLEFALRTSTPEEVCYEVKLPLDKKTDRLSNLILKLDPENATGVEWDEKKPKK
jgi:uncharacterized membrane protein YhiD involved in acid resistance